MSLKNWDNKTWLSSKKYIRSFNNFLLKQIKLNTTSHILDIGCGRGKIIGSLSSKLKLRNKPFGIDLINHKDKDKRINFKKTNATSFFSTNKKKFDLILIKQTIHLLKIDEIKPVLKKIKKSLKPQGKILILTLNPHKNELPSFALMRIRLLRSLKRDKKILRIIYEFNPKRIIRYFSFKVKISKKKYIDMISRKFISILLNFKKEQIVTGIKEINLKYKKDISFNDKLVCIIIKNN